MRSPSEPASPRRRLTQPRPAQPSPGQPPLRLRLAASHLRDRSDVLFYLALIALPVDGTVIGPYAPFWSPISPWLFLVYVLANPGALRVVYRRWRVWFLLPAALVVLSAPGWTCVAFHPVPAVTSLMAVVGALACLAALDVALHVKRLPWRPMVGIVLAAYWFAFAVGALQWAAARLELGAVLWYFDHLMLRSYVSSTPPWGGGRPQFLFAEPSYIGMHLFGVLLPLMWLTRGRDSVLAHRLRTLIAVFSVGAVVMGAGVRIILDALVALVVVIVECTRWHDAADRRRGVVRLAGAAVLGVLSIVANSRLSSIVHHGADGDGSFFARIYQSLGPLCGLLRRPLYLLTGFGAGNIDDATKAGADAASSLLAAFGFDPSPASAWFASMTPDTVWTMCAYTSFLTEYGLTGLALVVVLVIRHIVTVCRTSVEPVFGDGSAVAGPACGSTADIPGMRSWRKTLVCWTVLVAYLYIQFEGYAFAALPMLVWAAPLVARRRV
ncbi:hypothetical protein [Bifidobacterium samirii]|uniref:Uncharacterized protein n=1 Tax=Bifidobacterium samirii TaxID=2306974 RepID=A0A430FVM2_9BIFI|nr:hypothetical protein [Bifidobacterium samirii]RSX58064.1 hypothetical protein D2E24_0424 [Bifidobacterium samirii]